MISGNREQKPDISFLKKSKKVREQPRAYEVLQKKAIVIVAISLCWYIRSKLSVSSCCMIDRFSGPYLLFGPPNLKLCLNLNRYPHIACAWAIDPSGKKDSVCNSQCRPRIQLMRSIDCNNNSYNYKFLSMITITLNEGTHSQRWFLVVLKTIRHGFFVFVNFLCLKKTVVAFLAFTIFTFYQCNI